MTHDEPPTNPPSFRPSSRRPRPPAQGARRVAGRTRPEEIGQTHAGASPAGASPAVGPVERGTTPTPDVPRDAAPRNSGAPAAPPRRTSLRSPARDAVRRGAGGAGTAGAGNVGAGAAGAACAGAAGAAGTPGDAPDAPGHTRMMPAGARWENSADVEHAQRAHEAQLAHQAQHAHQAQRDLPPSYSPGGGAPHTASPSSTAPRTVSSRPGVVASGRQATSSPAGTARPARPAAGRPQSATVRPAKRRRPVRSLLIFVLVLLILWPVGLLTWANFRIKHTGPLPASANTPGTTYLLAGSDSRADGSVADGTQGQRADSILLLHDPVSGPTAMISLPRDTYVDIPGHGPNKLNAAYSLGGPELLASTVEDLTGIGVDHYVEIGMGGVTGLVDSVGGVNLCLDYDVQDEFSGLNWTAGCHDVDGTTALQFARMRYSDPQGDIGRGARQRQVIGAVSKKALNPATLINPAAQVRMAGAGTDALLTDPSTGIIDLGRMALAFRSATGAGGYVGAPPIASMNYSPGGIGSTVLLDEAAAPQFFDDLVAGRLSPQDASAPAG